MKRRTFLMTGISILISKLIPFNSLLSYRINNDIIIPDDLYFTRGHEWLRVEGNYGIVGITDYEQHELGDIIYIDFNRRVQDEVRQGESAASIEAVVTVTELFCPVSGIITEINNKINDNAQYVNKDPYGKGWLLKLRISDSNELKNLLDAKAYRELILKQ